MGPPIRTPDQRLRVFVSSTLRELATERAAVRGAVERLHLAPVMFELGARPHPPRELYRSYLAQSDVFVGLYADSYGWVAPGEELSGLEDEYRLADRAMPKLIYLREGAAPEERLAALIGRIERDDTASYKTFAHPDELARLVEDDLATLLAERFDAARGRGDAGGARPVATPVPVAYTPLVGREDDVTAVATLLEAEGARLVTLLGPGGIGKSRLAIAVAERVDAHFPGGVAFVGLENVLEPALLLPAIAAAVGVREPDAGALEDGLRRALSERRMLLVLDNFEQLVDAASALVRLFTIAPEVRFLVTSRIVLRVRGEHVYDVAPLPVVDPAAPESVTRALAAPAARLFVQRARAVHPAFEVTEGNRAAIVGVCRMLQGLPLAIELAAARVRVLPPADILARLDRQLPTLVGSARDLPERQRTLRRTIEWSTGMLNPEERALLAALGAFSHTFALASVEAVCARAGDDVDVVAALGALVDSSLVITREIDGTPVFSLLASVREWGVAQLRTSGREGIVRRAHAEVYVALAQREAPRLAGPEQVDAVRVLSRERSNLRSAVRHLVATGDADVAASVALQLFLFWWIGGYQGEIGVFMRELLERVPDAPPRARAIAMFYVAWIGVWTSAGPERTARLLEASELFARAGDDAGAALSLAASGIAQAASGDPDLDGAAARVRAGAEGMRGRGMAWGEVLCTVALGRIAWARGDDAGARAEFEEGARIAAAAGEHLTDSIVTHHLARSLLFAGEVDEAARVFARSLVLSRGLGHEEGLAYSLEGLCAVAAVRGDAARAGVLAGAAENIRRRTAIVDSPAFVFHPRYLAGLADAEAVANGRARGAEYGPDEIADFALAGV